MVTPHKKSTYPKHVQTSKVSVQTPKKTRWKYGAVTKSFKERTAITGITRTFTRNKFPRPNLSQRSAHVFAQLAIRL